MTKQTAKYAAHANLHQQDMQFKEGDLVLIRLHPERFPPGTYEKLLTRRVVYLRFSNNSVLIPI